MAREIEKLSDRKVRALKEPGYYHDGAGLYLQVTHALSKSWIFRFTLHGKTREMGLGSYSAFSLAEARERAREQRKLLADGIDPIAARDARQAQESAKRARSFTFAQCAESYIATKLKGKNVKKNPKHVQQWENTLQQYAYPVIEKLNVRDVDDAHVLRILEPIWNEKNETASRLRGRIEKVLDWATVQKLREGPNPARWRGNLSERLANRTDVHKVAHLAALPYKDIYQFMTDLREQPGIAARALELLILTAVRTGEVRGARPEEFDLDGGIWTIPAERMKAKKEHRVPLSPRALEIVKERIEAAPKAQYLFPYRNKPLSENGLLQVLRRMKRSGITVHGFRSTFRVWAAEETNYPRELAEFALAHKIPSEVEAAYMRTTMLEKRRQMMSGWADYCVTRPDTEKKGDVVAMRRKAS